LECERRTSIGLHELFDKIAEDVESYVDMIAERVVQMGGIAKARPRVTAARSHFKSIRWISPMEAAHVEAVARALSLLAAKRADRSGNGSA